MAKSRQSSFRRILLRRLLLLSIPVLLTGEVVAYKKARSGLLETARHNLTASAVRKSEALQTSIANLRSNLALATTSSALQTDSPQSTYDFLEQFRRTSAISLQCVQLINIRERTVKASTCGTPPIAQFPLDPWNNPTASDGANPRNIQVALAQPSRLGSETSMDHQLNLVLSAPVTIRSNNQATRYALSVQASLYSKPEPALNAMTTGYTVVIDDTGVILAHPIAERIGRNIRQEANAQQLQQVFENAIANSTVGDRATNQQESLDPVLFEENGAEWLAGGSAIQVALKNGESSTWVVLAATSVDSALYGLADIKQVLIILTLGLLTAILLATLYLTRDLARPIEQLSEYALKIRKRLDGERAPKNFKVRELNYLAEALDNMVERLEERASELEAAWQEAQSANQVKSEFLATTSHELRTPLNGIIGCIQLVRDGFCDSREEELEFLSQADKSAKHLLQIINDLLDLAKIEAGKADLNLQPIDIQHLCQECLKMVQPTADLKRLKLMFHFNVECDRVSVDSLRVSQMVINLLSNAVKFTPEGGTVSLVARIGYGYQLAQDVRPDRSPINQETSYLCLEVEDSGIGIPKDRWHLLFRPFQQIDSSMTRKHEGTGLGLALTKRLAEMHGGTLSFWSVPDKGSTFRIWLPWVEKAELPKTKTDGTEVKREQPLRTIEELGTRG
ncbi:integral membrane sensor signal transduction histidine kinase [Leptolyngbya sp. NIES-3755]|nr:integral membrane sensor signal transduction histidine kinase [Leptolyngbya sp. NIES-3755]